MSQMNPVQQDWTVFTLDRVYMYNLDYLICSVVCSDSYLSFDCVKAAKLILDPHQSRTLERVI